MRISHKYKFVFLSKWKCASESVREALNPYSDIFSSQKYPYYHHTNALMLKEHFDEQGWNWDEYYSFITVRNPWDMLVSLYYYGLPDSNGDYYWDRHWGEIVKDNYKPNWRVVPDNIVDFNVWINTFDFTPFTLDYFVNDAEGKCLVNEIVPLENLKKYTVLLNERFSFPSPVSIPYINRVRHPDSATLYSTQSVKRVAEIFALDIEAGGYKPPVLKKSKNEQFKRITKKNVCSLFVSERALWDDYFSRNEDELQETRQCVAKLLEENKRISARLVEFEAEQSKYAENIAILESERDAHFATRTELEKEKRARVELESVLAEEKKAHKQSMEKLTSEKCFLEQKLLAKEEELSHVKESFSNVCRDYQAMAKEYSHFVMNMHAWQNAMIRSWMTVKRFRKVLLPPVPSEPELHSLLNKSAENKSDPEIAVDIKISIITPSYNSGDTVERAIKSVMSQGYKNWEHIIVDGGSSDGSIEIFKKYPHLKWISEPDDGQVDAMNKGFQMATGDVVSYLNADDYYNQGAFESVVRAFSDDVAIVYGKVNVYEEASDSWWVNDPKYDFDSVLRHWEADAFCVNPVGYFYRKEVQQAIPYRKENGAKMDLAFLMEVAQKYEQQSRKIDFVLGVFMNCLGTQTVNEQSKEGYWVPENFSFIEPFLSRMGGDYQKAYRIKQLKGYAYREERRKQEIEQRKQTNELDEAGSATSFFPRFFCRSDLGLAYLSIPKNACTTLKFSLATAGRDNATEILKNPKALHLDVHRFFDLVVAADSEISNLFSFTFIRNPYDRFCSFYKNKIFLNWDKNMANYMESNGFRYKMSIDECLDVIASLSPNAMNEHFAPQSLFLFRDGRCVVDYVGCVEKLEEGIAFISKKSGVMLETPVINSTKGKVDMTLTKEQREKIFKIYKDDFALWDNWGAKCCLR